MRNQTRPLANPGCSLRKRALCLLALVCLLATLLPATVAMAENAAYIKFKADGQLWKAGGTESAQTVSEDEVFRTSDSTYNGWYRVQLKDGSDGWAKVADVSVVGTGTAILPDNVSKVKITVATNVVASDKTVLGTVAVGTVLTAVSVYNGLDSSDCWYQVTDGTTTGYVRYNEATAANLYENETLEVGKIVTSATPTPTPTAAPSDAGSKSSAIVPSATKVYVSLSKAVPLFTGETSGGTTVTAPAGSYLQLVADQTYTVSGTKYTCLYYNSARYNVLYSNVSGDKQTEAQTLAYITGTIWKQTPDPNIALKKALNLSNDIRVHALQLALRTLGYYNGSLDGSFGDGTESAVKAFQGAKGLKVDGSAGSETLGAMYPLAIATYGGSVTPITPSTSGTLVTTLSVNMRKSTSTRSTRYGTIPKGTTLAYTASSTADGVTWYKVSYTFGKKARTGWLMGTYVSTTGTGGGGTVVPGVEVGTVTILKKGTRVRKTPGGSKTGYTLGIGATVPLMATPTASGGYTWYYIKMSNGVLGYVRGDCAEASTGTGGGSTGTILLPSCAQLTANVAATLDSNGTTAATIPTGAIIILENANVYTISGAEVYKVYYNNNLYRVAKASLASSIRTEAWLKSYLTNTLWKGHVRLDKKWTYTGDMNCLSVQYALQVLGYYTGSLDGMFGPKASTLIAAIMNFQKSSSLEQDAVVGEQTQAALYARALAALNGGGTVATNFGTVTSVERCSQASFAGATGAFGKYGTVAVMDMVTRRVFTVYRVGGENGNHPDCIPASLKDTQTMCDIVGFSGAGYNGTAPTAAQLKQITDNAESSNSTYANNPTYTWPDFGGGAGSAKIGDDWDYRPVYINLGNGRVVCGAMYGMPHGCTSNWYTKYMDSMKFNNGMLWKTNNFYGVVCLHVSGSKGHTSGEESKAAQAAITTAYNGAKAIWPSATIKTGVQ